MKSGAVAVILAGGLGERFWPATRPGLPKYAMPLEGKTTFLAATWKRLERLHARDRIYVVTAAEDAALVRKLLPGVPASRVLAEPERRNTAGAVTYAACVLKARFGGGAVLSFYPADAWIGDAARFARTLRSAQALAAARDRIVVVGIRPTFPATGFGYVERGRPVRGAPGAFEVRRFTEKPDLATARRFLRSGRHLWNAGIFTWRIRVFEEALRRRAPGYHARFHRLFERPGAPADFRRAFRGLPAGPIDRILLEKTPGLLVVLAGFGWDDIGTWDALRRRKKDREGNVLRARGHFEDVRDSVVIAEPGLRVTLAGVRGLVVAQSGRDLLICGLDRSQDVARLKRIVEGARRPPRKP
jgi:mannose-1-phosphate guanylyltransferase